jgi:outer membrane putative beta-barrel porin/alpha-amylase
LAIKVFVLLAMVVAPSLAAQTDSSTRDPHLVQPERPTVATHAYTVARGWLELEEGGEWDKASDGTRSFFAPTNLKIGLASAAQVNIMFNVIHDHAIRSGNLTLSDVTLGVKYRILEGDRILGDFAILPAVKLPTGTKDEGGSGTTDFSLLLISSRQLGPVQMDLNVGATRRTGNGSNVPASAAIWTASFGSPISGAFGGVLEFFGYPGTSGPAGEKPTAAILVGPTFLVRKWLALDAGIIAPVLGPQAHAIYTGFVWSCGVICGHQPH